MSQFKVGDIVIITRVDGPAKLCVLGKVLEVDLEEPYRGCIHIDTLWRHDPKDDDAHNTGYWPTDVPAYITIERCGPEVPTDAV